MKVTAAAALSLAGLVAANPVDVVERQSCPKVYVFGARETTVPPGYGTAGGLVNQVVAAYPGAGSEPISYPACGGQSNCGGVPYEQSAQQGTAAVVKAVTDYNKKCPSTQIVLIGYSQVHSFNGFCTDKTNRLLSRVVRLWTTLSAAAQAQRLPATH